MWIIANAINFHAQVGVYFVLFPFTSLLFPNALHKM